MKSTLTKIGFLVLLLLFSYKTKAQEFVFTEENVLASDYSCSDFQNYTTISIGDGNTATTLNMDNELNLICLERPILFILRKNATVDFTSGNNYLILPENSAVIIEEGGVLEGGSCNASERIYIGNVLLASCNGSAGAKYSFAELMNQGEFNLPNNVSNGFEASIICEGETPYLTFNAVDVTFSSPYIVTYKNDRTASVYSIEIPSKGEERFIPADNPTTNTGYTLISISNANWTKTSNFGDSGANLIIRPIPVASMKSDFTDMTEPKIIFTNPQTVGITVIYSINEAEKNTIDVPANSTNFISLPVTTTSPGKYNYRMESVNYKTTPGCLNMLSGDATVEIPSAPKIETIVQTSCKSSKGSVVLSGLPEGNWDLYMDNGNAPLITDGAGTSVEVTDLSPGSHYFIVNNKFCNSTLSQSVEINSPPPTKTWNGSEWSPDPLIIPTIENKIVFNGDYSSSSDVEACSCFVNNAKVIINSGNTLTVANEVDVDNSGSLTFENNASLVQFNDEAVNDGNIIYKRNTTPILKTDYTYWASPVAGFNLGKISSGTFYYSFDAIKNGWVTEYENTIMTVGKGYIVRGPYNYSTTLPEIYTSTFTGKPNNGIIKVAVGGEGTSNLVGNPYPSAVRADDFLEANSDVLEGTLYFWTHNTAIQLATNINNGSAGTGTYAYTSDDYAVYNLTGGISTAAVSGGTEHLGMIAASQGFMADGYSEGEAKFDNSMRASGGISGVNNAQFFKIGATNKDKSLNKRNRLWLNLTNQEGAFKQLLIGYVAGATNGYDRGYDGVNINGNEYINFYSLITGKYLTIQARALPFDKTDVVKLGFETAIEGKFTISIGKKDGFLSGTNIFLIDKLLGVSQNLNELYYTFYSGKGVFDNRFEIQFLDPEKNKIPVTAGAITNGALLNFAEGSSFVEGRGFSISSQINGGDDVSIDTAYVLGVKNSNGKGSLVTISVHNRELTINSPDVLIDKIIVYDTSGKLLFRDSSVSGNRATIKQFSKINSIFFVKIMLNNGEEEIKKVMF